MISVCPILRFLILPRGTSHVRSLLSFSHIARFTMMIKSSLSPAAYGRAITCTGRRLLSAASPQLSEAAAESIQKEDRFGAHN